MSLHSSESNCGQRQGELRTRFHKSLLGAAALVALAASLPAMAQEADPPAEVEPAAAAVPAPAAEEDAERLRRLGIVTVTARRREESLQDAPVAITAFSGEGLDDYAVTRFQDLSTLVPTMVAGKAASGSSASIFLRGVGSTALSAGFDQSVSFIIDGMPMSRGREISLAQYDIERVEVLKGPQALFYGKNTTGGLISVVTKSPADEFEASAKTGYGFEAREIYGEGIISGPLTDALRARLAVRLSESDGAFTNTAAASYTDPFGMTRSPVADRRGGSEMASGRLTLAFEPNDMFDLELKAGITQMEDGGPTDVLERICGSGRTTPATANGVPPSPNADCRIDGRSDSSRLPAEVASANYRYARDGAMYAEFESSFAVLTGNLDFDKLGVSSITSFYQFEQTDLNNVAGEAYPASFSQLADFSQFSQELRFQTRFDSPLNFMFGAFLANSEFTFNTDAYIFPVPIDPLNGTYVTFKRDNGFEGDALSFFVEGTYDITDQWELSGGARWSQEERDSYQRSLPGHIAFAGAFPGNISLEDSFKDENISPQATLRWKPSANISVYGAYKEGFKTGGYNISQALTPLATVEAGQYDSETAKGFEAGVRSLLFNDSLTLNATVYDYTYENLQVQVFDPVSVSLIADNAGELETKGVEIDFNWVPRDLTGFSVRGAFAYNDATYQNYVGQCYGGQTVAQGCDQVLVGGVYQSQDYSGRRPPKAPETAGRLGASYEFPVFGNLMASVSADASYTGSYNFTDTLRPDAVQDSFTRLDAAARLMGQDDRWELALIGRNLTEEFVVTSANDIPFSGGIGTGTTTGVTADMSAFVENPREIYLELSLRF